MMTRPFLLDRDGTVVQYWGRITPIGANATVSETVSDTPSSPLAGQIFLNRHDRFKTYLMYQPNGANSIWVTLAAVEWYWKGAAGLDNTGTWVIVGKSGSSTNPASYDSIHLPEWKGRLQDLQWVPDPPTVTAVAPATGVNNNAALAITVTGTNFCPARDSHTDERYGTDNGHRRCRG